MEKIKEKHLTRIPNFQTANHPETERIDMVYTMTDTEQTHRIKMRPRARVIRLIGEELISDEGAALVELVKNAYDADASEAIITFEKINDPEWIEIEDDGCGMTLEDIKRWFEPGVSKKREPKISDEGRVLLGEKGIGRFAAAKLGRVLEVKTKSKKEGLIHFS